MFYRFPIFPNVDTSLHYQYVIDPALDLGIETLSLIVSEQNVSALRWYERLGFREIDRRAVVPHPMIRYTGDALLMTAQV